MVILLPQTRPPSYHHHKPALTFSGADQQHAPQSKLGLAFMGPLIQQRHGRKKETTHFLLPLLFRVAVVVVPLFLHCHPSRPSLESRAGWASDMMSIAQPITLMHRPPTWEGRKKLTDLQSPKSCWLTRDPRASSGTKKCLTIQFHSFVTTFYNLRNTAPRLKEVLSAQNSFLSTDRPATDLDGA